MKLSKNKIIVSALALAIGTSLAGSISGTLAWYQYSTRANVSFLGQSSGISSNLQMRFVGEGENDWRTRITKEEMAANLNGTGTKLVPMTFGGIGMTDALPLNAQSKPEGYLQPSYGHAEMNSWSKAAEANYAQFKLELRYNERDGVKEAGVDAKNKEKKVYLSKLLLQEDVNNGEKGDISDAVRVHISASYNDGAAHTDNKLISKKGGTTVTHGVLDLDNDGKVDKEFPDNDEFGFAHTADQMVDINYGGADSKQSAFAGNDVGGNSSYFNESDQATEETVYPALVTSTNNVLSNVEKQNIPNVGDVEKYIGKTMESETQYLTVTVTVWVEGWHRFDYSAREGSPKFDAIWDEVDLVNAKFDLGLQFAVQDASVAE